METWAATSCNPEKGLSTKYPFLGNSNKDFGYFAEHYHSCEYFYQLISTLPPCCLPVAVAWGALSRRPLGVRGGHRHAAGPANPLAGAVSQWPTPAPLGNYTLIDINTPVGGK